MALKTTWVHPGPVALQMIPMGPGLGPLRNPELVAAPRPASHSAGAVTDTAASLGRRMAYENFLASAISGSIVESFPKLPWEQGIWAAAPHHLRQPFKHHAVGVGDLFVPASQPAVPAPMSAPTHSYPDFVKKRLRLGTLHREESEIRALQLRKLRTIVLQEPSSSELGCALVNAAGALQDEEIVVRSFRDAFMSKSTGTLLKRVSSLWPFCCYLNDNLVPPLDFREELLYDFLNLMREHKRGATAASSLLSAIRFIHGVLRAFLWVLRDDTRSEWTSLLERCVAEIGRSLEVRNGSVAVSI